MTKLLINAHIIDGIAEQPIEQGYLLIDETAGVILAMGTGDYSQHQAGLAPEDVIDVAGGYITPGLIDCHVHTMRDGSHSPDVILRTEQPEIIAIRCIRNAQRHLEVGITTIKDNGSPGLSAISAKKAFDMGLFVGPYMLAAGAPIIMTGGHFKTGGVEIDGADQARKEARLHLKNGANFIKMLASGGINSPKGEEPGSPELTVEEMKAAVEVAHAKGRIASIHAEGLEGIRNALAAGADTIEHCCCADDDCITQFVKQGVYMIPTIKAIRIVAEEDLGLPAQVVEKAKKIAAVHFPVLQKAIKAGVKIAAGTDSCSPGFPPERYFEELLCYEEAGMTRMNVIKTATANAADAIGLAEELGTLKPGLRADFLILEANPLEDLMNLRKQRAVYHYGKKVQLPLVCPLEPHM